MYNFASEFDQLQEHIGTPDEGPGESNNDDDISRTVLGDRAAVRGAGARSRAPFALPTRRTRPQDDDDPPRSTRRPDTVHTADPRSSPSPQKPTGPSGLDAELGFNGEGVHVLGDLPSSAMKATGEPMVAGLDSTMVGKNAVSAAAEAVVHARQRIDMVRPSSSYSRDPREDIFGFHPRN